jgi:hypothetical protein
MTTLKLALACLLTAAESDQPPNDTVVTYQLPDPELRPAGNINYLDLHYFPALGRVVVPAGSTGALILIDPREPDRDHWTVLTGFEASRSPASGAGSAVEISGILLATDRQRPRLPPAPPDRLIALDTATSTRIAGAVRLGQDRLGRVRYLDLTREIWATDDANSALEMYPALDPLLPASRASYTLPVPGNLFEGVAIDEARGYAYAAQMNWSTGAARTAVVDLLERRILYSFDPGCGRSGGMLVDQAHGFLVASCAIGPTLGPPSGTLSVWSPSGALITRRKAEAKLAPNIAFNPELRHLYVPEWNGHLAIYALTSTGGLSLLASVPIPLAEPNAVTHDPTGAVWMTGLHKELLIRVQDGYPPVTR